MSAEDERATKTVLEVLGSDRINDINFMMGEISVSPSMYALVAKAIQDKEITVLVLPNILPAKTIAGYFRKLPFDKDKELYDVMALRKAELGSRVEEVFEAAMAIIHECTHAGFYAAKTPNMTHIQHEAASYIAAGTAGVAEVLDRGGKPDSITFQVPLLQMGWDMGLMVNKTPVPGSPYWSSPDFAVKWWSSLNKLYVAIGNSDMYKATAKDQVPNDGVGHEWKLPKTP